MEKFDSFLLELSGLEAFLLNEKFLGMLSHESELIQKVELKETQSLKNLYCQKIYLLIFSIFIVTNETFGICL